ncbi:MAG TPA: hypothetical protein VEW03_03990 [Longimicrobiaceae bacterium]|nr:hypothetical protein [Longimicrobiaceae bacterium]
MKKTTVGILAALAAVTAASGASAQICAGFPTGDRQFTFGANLLFPEGAEAGDIWGVEVSYNAQGPLGFFGGVTFFDDGEDSEQSFGAGVAWELVSLGAMIGPSVSACPVVSFEYLDIDGFGSALAVPVGVGFGTNLSAGPGFSLSPYIIPAVIFSQFNPDDDLFPGADSESDTNFGIDGGVLLGFGTFFIGGTIQHVFQDDADPTFGIRAGIRL